MLRGGAPIERDRLAELLWPESLREQALHNLRMCLTDLRRALGVEAYRLETPTRHSLALSLAGVEVDLLAFDSAVARGDPASLEDAVRLYRGPFLDGCAEEWAEPESEQRREAYLAALESLAALDQSKGDTAAAERHLRRAIAADPFRETAHRALMTALAAAGRHAAAFQVYQELRAELQRSLDTDPEPETRTLFEQIRSAAPAGAGELAGRPPAPRPARRQRCCVPVPLTPLLAREREAGTVAELLRRPGVRLVTLTGPAGIGKTRLALHLGETLGQEFSSGACFVPLAPVRDPAALFSAINGALGVDRRGNRSPAERLFCYLRERELLLVLDNCEQILDAAPLVVELLEAAPRVKALVTSRGPLRVRGERRLAVQPLAVPGIQAFRRSGVPAFGRLESRNQSSASERLTPDRLDALLAFPGVQLFLQRAAAADPAFRLTATNGPAVASLCRQLNGLPLALELAAARVAVMSPAAMLAGFRDAPAPGRVLGLLEGGPRDLPPRQQSMRDAIAWSYDLLGPEERTLLQCLSVFSGGWDSEAAAALGDGDARRLAVLVDCGLVQREGAGERGAWAEPTAAVRGKDEPEAVSGEEEPRFGMLETIREFAAEQLAASGSGAEAGDAHALCFLARVTRRDGEFLPWLEGIEREYLNVRTALDWLAARGQTESASHLATELWTYWYRRGLWSEGREKLSAVLALPGVPPARRARLLRQAGQLAWLQSDYRAAGSLLTESLRLYEELGDALDLPAPLNAVGELARTRGGHARARCFFERSLAILCAAGDRANEAWALQALGEVARETGDASAQPLLEESLVLFREAGDERGVSFALRGLAQLAVAENRLDEARGLCQESLSIQQRLGQKGDLARSLCCLGGIAAAAGDEAAAWNYFGECLPLCVELGDPRITAAVLEAVAGALLATGAPATAAGVEPAGRLLAAADGIRCRLGAPLPPIDRPGHARLLAAIRVTIGDRALEELWRKAQSIPGDQALEEAETLVRGRSGVAVAVG